MSARSPGSRQSTARSVRLCNISAQEGHPLRTRGTIPRTRSSTRRSPSIIQNSCPCIMPRPKTTLHRRRVRGLAIMPLCPAATVRTPTHPLSLPRINQLPTQYFLLDTGYPHDLNPRLEDRRQVADGRGVRRLAARRAPVRDMRAHRSALGGHGGRRGGGTVHQGPVRGVWPQRPALRGVRPQGVGLLGLRGQQSWKTTGPSRSFR